MSASADHQMRLYRELAPYYFDIEKPGRRLKDEFAFLDGEFRARKIERALDIGCGSGEHAAHLSKMGYAVTGLDSSAAMLEVARRRFPWVTFEQGGMEDYRAQYRFDGLFSIFGTFNYLVEDDAVKRALGNFHNLLKPHGTLLLEVWHAYPIKLIKRKPMTNVASVISGEKMIQRNRGFRLLRWEDQTVVEVNYTYEIDSKKINDRHIMRAFDLDEMRAFLKAARFKVLDVLGGMDRSRVTDEKGHLLFIAEQMPH